MVTFFRRAVCIAAALTATLTSFAPRALAADFNNPNDKPILCQLYAGEATYQAEQNQTDNCGGVGDRWTTDKLGHYNWCMAQKDVKVVNTEASLRKNAITRCTRCSGFVYNRGEFEKQWIKNGCGNVPELRQMDRFRGMGGTNPRLLMFSCTSKPMTPDEIAAEKQADDHALALCIAHKNPQASSIKRAACGSYATDAVEKAKQFQANNCAEDARFPGRMSTDVYEHYDWCLNVASGAGVEFERNRRNADLQQCLNSKKYEHKVLFTPVTKLGVKHTPTEEPTKTITKSVTRSVQPPRFKFPRVVLHLPKRHYPSPVVVAEEQTSTAPARPDPVSTGTNRPDTSHTDTGRTDTGSSAPATSDVPRSRSGQTEDDLGFPPKVVTKTGPTTPPVVVSDVPRSRSGQTEDDLGYKLPPIGTGTGQATSARSSSILDGLKRRSELMRKRFEQNNATAATSGAKGRSRLAAILQRHAQTSKAVATMNRRGIKERLTRRLAGAASGKHRVSTGLGSRFRSAVKRSGGGFLKRLARH